MSNSVEYVSLPKGCAESGGITGALLPLFFSKGKQRGRELTFHHSIIGNFTANKV